MRPALRPVARISGDAGTAGVLREQAGEAAPAVVLDSARQPDGGGAHPARGEGEDAGHRLAATADRALGGQRVLLGGGPARRHRRARDGDERPAGADQQAGQGGEGLGLLGDVPGDGLG